MKTLKTWLVTIAVLLCSISVSSHDFEVDGIYYKITDRLNHTVEITTAGSGINTIYGIYSGNVIVPQTVTHNDTTYLVIGIGYRAFYECSNLVGVELPNTLTYIEAGAFDGCNLPVENNIIYAGNWAVGVIDKDLPRYVMREGTKGMSATFDQCRNLVKISFPKSLKYICKNSFYACSALKEITLPDSMISIGSSAFAYCRNLETIKMSNSVTEIGFGAFEECSSLKDITWSENIISLGPWAFYGCNSLESIVLPDKLDSIGPRAFEGCSSLYISKLPEKLRVIAWQAFWNGPSFSNDFDLPDSIETIETRAFGMDIVFDTITFPETIITEEGFFLSSINTAIIKSPNMIKERLSVRCNLSKIRDCRLLSDTTDLPDCYFLNCSTLVSVTLPNSLKRIGESFFEGCTALTNITIPSSVTTINDYAFAGCTNLSAVICDGATPPTCGTGTFEDVNTAECTLDVPGEAIDMYATTAPWSDFNIKVSLVDDEYYKNEVNTELDQITYTRTLNNTEWNALYVPFEIPVSQLIDDYEVAYINGIHSYDDDDNGEIDRMSMEVVKVKSGTLHANHPYLIKARTEEAKAMNIAVNNTTLYAAESTTLDCSSIYTKYEITGIYERMTGSELAGCYALSGGTWKTIASNSYLNPFRLYLRITSRGNSPIKVSPLAMTRINIHVQGEESSTSVEEMMMQEQLPNDEIIYDLMGRRVENPVKGHIYIVNGMKRVY